MEERLVLQDYETTKEKSKRTHAMTELLSKFGTRPVGRLANGAVMTKGYKTIKSDNLKAQIIFRRKQNDQIRRLTAVNTVRFRNIQNMGIITYRTTYDNLIQLKADKLDSVKLLVRKDAQPKMTGVKIPDPQMNKLVISKK